jgi:hypothetical protein
VSDLTNCPFCLLSLGHTEREHVEAQCADRQRGENDAYNRIAELEQALRKYGRHGWSSSRARDAVTKIEFDVASRCTAATVGPCTCGLDDALAKAKEQG